MDFDKSHQFTAAQAQAAEDRVVQLKDLQDEVWELLLLSVDDFEAC